MSDIITCFKTLGVPTNATIEQVKKAYKKLALKKHPDRGGDIREFQNISNAYDEILRHFDNVNSKPMMHPQNFFKGDIFNQNQDLFSFVFNQKFNNATCPPSVYSENSYKMTPNKKVFVNTQIVNGSRKTTIREIDLVTGTTKVYMNH